MKLLKKTKSLVPKKKELPINLPLTEEEYYTDLFTRNEFWSSKLPNEEEQKRWQVIEQFIYFIKGNQVANSNGETMQILDLGCGRGWLTKLLSQYGNVTGIEPVKPVVEFGRKNYPDLNLLNGDSAYLLQNGNQGKFDMLVSSEVIEHIPDDKKNMFVEDIYQLLKPNGFVIITTPRKEAENEWNKYCKDGQPVEDWNTEAEIKGYFEAKNFNTHLLKRLNIKPEKNAAEIEIYQLWLFQKK